MLPMHGLNDALHFSGATADINILRENALRYKGARARSPMPQVANTGAAAEEDRKREAEELREEPTFKRARTSGVVEMAGRKDDQFEVAPEALPNVAAVPATVNHKADHDVVDGQHQGQEQQEQHNKGTADGAAEHDHTVAAAEIARDMLEPAADETVKEQEIGQQDMHQDEEDEPSQTPAEGIEDVMEEGDEDMAADEHDDAQGVGTVAGQEEGMQPAEEKAEEAGSGKATPEEGSAQDQDSQAASQQAKDKQEDQHAEKTGNRSIDGQPGPSDAAHAPTKAKAKIEWKPTATTPVPDSSHPPARAPFASLGQHGPAASGGRGFASPAPGNTRTIPAPAGPGRGGRRSSQHAPGGRHRGRFATSRGGRGPGQQDQQQSPGDYQ